MGPHSLSVQGAAEKMSFDSDVIVVGGGIVGLWTAYHLVSQGVRTILLEQFPYPHTRGSSHGQSRIIRTSYCGEEYASMMPESYRKWRELEKESGKQLLLKTGLVTMFNMDDEDEVKAFHLMLTNLQKYAPDHEILPGEDVQTCFPGLAFNQKFMALLDVEAGLLKADRCLEVLQKLFINRGGTIYDHEKVVSVQPVSESKVEVTTSRRRYFSKSVVVTCGSYTNSILSSVNLQLPLKVLKAAVFYWKDTSATQKYSLFNGFPATSLHQANSYYSIPSYEYPGMMKICYGAITAVDPDCRNVMTSEIKETEEKRMAHLREQIQENFPDIDNSCPMIREDCVYTRTPDWNFIIDHHPRHKNIIIGAGFSGHGFKTAPSVGHMLANMAIGLEAPYSLKPFSLRRFWESKL